MAQLDILINAKDNATDVLSSVGGAMLSVAGIAAGALATGLGISIAAAMDNEKAQASLAQVLQSTQGAAGLTAEAANALAVQFMDLAGGSDDAILAIETIGLRAGTIAADQMPGFIQATLDLGAVMGDTSAAATLLARAQEDPISTLGRLTKAGIIFTEEQNATIKSLVDSGDTAGATEIIMARLAETTGGAAAANAGTLAGQLEIMKGRMGEAAETIGTAFLPVLHELFDATIAPAIPILESFAGKFSEQIPQALDLGRVMFENIVTYIQDNYLPLFAPMLDALQNLWDKFEESLPAILATVQSTFDTIKGIFETYLPGILANVTDTLNTMAEFWDAHGTQILAFVSGAFIAIATVVGGTLTVISGLISVAMEYINGLFDFYTAVFKGDWEGAMNALLLTAASVWATIQGTFDTVFNAILSLMGTDLDTLRETWQTNLEMLVTIATTTFNNVVLAISTGMLTAITTAQTIVAGFVTIGENIITGLMDGVKAKAQALFDAVAGVIGSAISTATGLLKSHSPSLVFAEIGKSIGEGLVAGIASTSDSVNDSISGLLSVGGKLSSIGGGLGSIFEKETVKPLKEGVKAWDKTVATLSKQFEKGGFDPSFLGKSVEELTAMQRLFRSLGGTQAEGLDLAIQLAEAREHQLKTTKEAAAAEQHLLDLQKQQRDLNFLQQQFNLMDLIAKHGLNPAEILGGMELGLNASLPGLMDAMTRAMQGVIAQANNTLGVHSPSAVFANIGQQVVNGLVGGIASGQARVNQAAGNLAAGVSNTFNLNFNGGANDVDMALTRAQAWAGAY